MVMVIMKTIGNKSFFDKRERNHDTNAEHNGNQLNNCSSNAAHLVQCLHHICQCNVEKCACCESEKPTIALLGSGANAKADYTTNHRRQRRQEIEQQGLLFRKASVNKNGKISKFLRQFMATKETQKSANISLKKKTKKKKQI